MQAMTSVSVRFAVWMMAMLPLSLAVLFHTGLRSVPLSIDVPQRPSLAFHQYAVDLRTIRPATVIEASYVFQNRGTEPVHIVKLDPSCGCLTPRLIGARDNIIEAGEQGRIVIRMQPANTSPGPHEYTVNVKYTDPMPREVQLKLKMEIPATLWVTPPALVVYHPAGSEPTLAEFTVTDGRGKSFEITDVSINTDLVETSLGESSRSPIGNYQQSVRVSIAGTLPPGRAQFLLRITTTDPDVGELRVPIMLQGQALPTDGESDHALDHELHKHQRHSQRIEPADDQPRRQDLAETPDTKVSLEATPDE